MKNKPLSKVERAIALWGQMTVEEKTALVKFLGADTGVRLYTEGEIQDRVDRTLAAQVFVANGAFKPGVKN